MKHRLQHWIATGAMCALILSLTACVSGGLLGRWAQPEEPAMAAIVENVSATVVTDGRPIPQGSNLAGTVVIVEFGGVRKPLVCIGQLERRCLDFRSGDAVFMNEVSLRPGALRIGGADYSDYWLAIGDKGVRRSM